MFENSRLSRYKIGKIIECFCIDIDTARTALLLKLNRKTVDRYFLAFRWLIYLHRVSKKEQLLGVVEVGESFFGPPGFVGGRPPKGAGARLNSRSSASMSMTERFTQSWARTARPKRFKPPSGARFRLKALSIPTAGKVMTDCVDVGYGKHFGINKARHFAEKSVHINGIEAFWRFTKRRLIKFNDVKQNFELHLTVNQNFYL